MDIQTTDPTLDLEVQSIIGLGSYARVHKCIEIATGEELAVKIFHKSIKQEIVINEYDIGKTCIHDNLLRAHKLYDYDDRLWLTMDYSDGGSVNDLLHAINKTLSECLISQILKATLNGLNFLHQQGKVHRDVKCANILISTDGRIRLADFGILTQLESKWAQSGTLQGSPYWISPELVKRERYGTSTDIWSLGIAAIEAAEGQPPYSNIHQYRVAEYIKNNPATSLTNPQEWSDDFNDFVSLCLIVDPEQRTTATQLLEHKFVANHNHNECDSLAELISQNFEAITEYQQALFQRRHRQLQNFGKNQGDTNLQSEQPFFGRIPDNRSRDSSDLAQGTVIIRSAKKEMHSRSQVTLQKTEDFAHLMKDLDSTRPEKKFEGLSVPNLWAMIKAEKARYQRQQQTMSRSHSTRLQLLQNALSHLLKKEPHSHRNDLSLTKAQNKQYQAKSNYCKCPTPKNQSIVIKQQRVFKRASDIDLTSQKVNKQSPQPTPQLTLRSSKVTSPFARKTNLTPQRSLESAITTNIINSPSIMRSRQKRRASRENSLLNQKSEQEMIGLSRNEQTTSFLIIPAVKARGRNGQTAHLERFDRLLGLKNVTAEPENSHIIETNHRTESKMPSENQQGQQCQTDIHNYETFEQFFKNAFNCPINNTVSIKTVISKNQNSFGTPVKIVALQNGKQMKQQSTGFQNLNQPIIAESPLFEGKISLKMNQQKNTTIANLQRRDQSKRQPIQARSKRVA